MLTELCAEIRNYFLRNGEEDIHAGTFEIVNGEMQSLPFLQDGQYYRIVGSVFNDGVWQYPFSQSGDSTLTDEVFTGAVWAMAVPPSVIALADEIATWISTYGEILNSPYTSESFAGYSFTKASSGSGNASGVTWQGQFEKRLNKYRRINIL